jgi:hypothetical protein
MTPEARGDDQKVELLNRTARRISISRGGGDGLVLAPFGVLDTTEQRTRSLDLDVWLERGYVEKRRPLGDPEPAFDPSTLAGLLFLLGFGVLVSRSLNSWAPAAIGAGLVALSLIPEVRRWSFLRKRSDVSSAETPLLRDQLWRALGMLAISLTGFGLPIAVTFLQTGLSLGQFLAQSPRSLVFLGLFGLFVGSAATLPAMLFFLFTEHRQPVLKEQFHRDILRLDPALRTVGEAERTYAPLLKEALHVRRGPLFFGPIILSTFLLSLGWTIAALPTQAVVRRVFAEPPIELWSLFVPNRTAFTFAFLGTYFFSLNMVFRRYVRADLGPKAYSHISVRIIIASILAWVASQTFEGFGDAGAALSGALPDAAALTGGGAGASVGNTSDVSAVVTPWHMLLLAFFIGIVPDTGVAILHDLLKTRFVSFFVPTMNNRDALTELEGITLYDRARLLEEGIENIENLAHHNLIELVLRTRIPAPRLVDLVDQAVLYLHARDEPADNAAGVAATPAVRATQFAQARLLQQLKARGIRTATDLEQASQDRQAYASLVTDLGERIRLVVFALSDDEWMPQLRSWREFRKTYETVYTLDDLTRPSAPSSRPFAGERRIFSA